MNGRFLYGANVFANGIRQHYLRYGGKGPVVVLVPGITSPAITWGFVAERLALRHDVYVLDVRGRGLSSTGPELDYGLDAMADDVIAFAGELGLKHPAILGHSMGARIAMRASNRSPSVFSRLALIDPPVSGPGRRPYPSKLPWYTDSIALAEKGMDGEAMKAFCPTWTEEQLQLRAEWLHTCYAPGIIKAFSDFHDIDILPDFGTLTVPAMLMVAGRGGVIQAADEEEIKGLNPSLQITHAQNAGHMIPWDDFEGFFVALGDFLIQ
ncbi:alpha/beta hydrolase [Neorhizobium sp. P12A]|uniref:alpha/beta fold hydrolase n=1 Tax=Neorhizobium sp. P12A TaxID=2268027 RepID=UPI0011EBAAE9|nr:alpha/beta hydrolase [Neorhizobium sp. P12A]KAA0693658.1 alpha/beta hydrolase [Neorhizobium sp. P12A]